MHKYIKRYVIHFELEKLINFHSQVNSIAKEGINISFQLPVLVLTSTYIVHILLETKRIFAARHTHNVRIISQVRRGKWFPKRCRKQVKAR